MKNSIQIRIGIIGLMGFVAMASAKDGNQGGGNQWGNRNSGNNSNNNNQGNKQLGAKVAKLKDVFNNLSHQDHGHHGWNQVKPDDSPYVRPQGDGRVPTPDIPTITVVNPVTTTPPANSRPGYVWNNGHWERAKADGTSINTSGAPLTATVVVRDHQAVTPPPAIRPGGSGYAPNNGYKLPPVANNGTITVTVTPGSSPRDNTIYGTGPGLYEVLKLGDPRLPYEWRPFQGFEAPPLPDRDHRTPNKNSK